MDEGSFLTGDKIPSEAELSKQFDVSRITVNTAIKELASVGVVERIQGKGTFVLSPDKLTGKQSMAFSGKIKPVSFEHSSRKPYKLMEHGVIKAGRVLCAKLNLEEGAYVYKIVRCVCTDNQSNELDYSYIPLCVCSNYTFDCEALEKIFVHDYVRRYFNEKPTHIKIYVNTEITQDMDFTALPIEKTQDMLTWDTFLNSSLFCSLSDSAKSL